MKSQPSLWCLLIHRLLGWSKSDRQAVWCARCGQRWPFADVDTAPPGFPQLFGNGGLTTMARPAPVTITRQQHLKETAPVVKIGPPAPSLTFRLVDSDGPVALLSVFGEWLRVQRSANHFTELVRIDDVHADDRQRVQQYLKVQPGTEWSKP